MWKRIQMLLVCSCLLSLSACGSNKPKPAAPPRPVQGQLQRNDLEPCNALVVPEDDTRGAADVAITTNNGQYIECQERHGVLAEVLRKLIQAGLLEFVH